MSEQMPSSRDEIITGLPDHLKVGGDAPQDVYEKYEPAPSFHKGQEVAVLRNIYDNEGNVVDKQYDTNMWQVTKAEGGKVTVHYEQEMPDGTIERSEKTMPAARLASQQAEFARIQEMQAEVRAAQNVVNSEQFAPSEVLGVEVAPAFATGAEVSVKRTVRDEAGKRIGSELSPTSETWTVAGTNPEGKVVVISTVEGKDVYKEYTPQELANIQAEAAERRADELKEASEDLGEKATEQVIASPELSERERLDVKIRDEQDLLRGMYNEQQGDMIQARKDGRPESDVADFWKPTLDAQKRYIGSLVNERRKLG